MDLTKERVMLSNIPPERRKELHEAFKTKIKVILKIYSMDLSKWLDDRDAKESISEFIDRWVENNQKPED